MQHTDRTFHGIDGSVRHSDSLVLVLTYDYLELKPISDVTPIFREAEVSECEGLYCSEPFYIPTRNFVKLVFLFLSVHCTFLELSNTICQLLLVDF